MSEIDKMADDIAADHTPFGDYVHEDVIAAIRASLLAAPPGWKLVPVEPTDEMLWGAEEIEVGYPAWAGSRDTCSDDEARKIWAAMISAAPEPK